MSMLEKRILIKKRLSLRSTSRSSEKSSVEAIESMEMIGPHKSTELLQPLEQAGNY